MRISRLDARFTAHFDERKEVKVAFSDLSRVDIFFARKEKTPLESAVQSVAEWVQRYGAQESNTF
jgi:hypothetical protein